MHCVILLCNTSDIDIMCIVALFSCHVTFQLLILTCFMESREREDQVLSACLHINVHVYACVHMYVCDCTI